MDRLGRSCNAVTLSTETNAKNRISNNDNWILNVCSEVKISVAGTYTHQSHSQMSPVSKCFFNTCVTPVL